MGSGARLVDIRHTTQTELVDFYDGDVEELDLVYTEAVKPARP